MDLVHRNGKTPATPPPMVAITPDALARALAVLTDDEFDDIIEKARGPRLVTLAELIMEGLGRSAYDLQKRLGDEVMTDDIGRDAVTRDTARRLFAERKALQQRQRDQTRSAGEPEIRKRVRAIAEQNGNSGLAIHPPQWGIR